MPNNNSIKWKRFSRTPYALFNSLHREVVIGVLTCAMLQSTGLSSKAGASGIMSVSSFGQTDDAADGTAVQDSLGVGLSAVEVIGTRVPLSESQSPRMVTVLHASDIQAAAVHSINDLLEYAVGVDVRQRGELGVQTDLSVRGGTFDQITLLINGVNISSPQTGHHSADFPVGVDDIERVEVVEGPAARIFGTSAFTGVVNIVTRQLPTDSNSPLHTTLHLRGGSYGYGAADARIALRHRAGSNGNFSHMLSGGYSRSDGATENSDFSNSHLFYHGQYTAGDVRVSAQAGYSYKPYGANTFYGAASTDQWESIERFMAALRAETAVGAFHLTPMVYWNRVNNHYQWHRGVSPAGENYHQVDVYGLSLNSWLQTRLGRTAFGVEMRSEAIWSTNLGKPLDEDDYRETAGHDGTSDRLYTHYDQRTNVSVFLEHNVLLRQWTVSLGMLANYNTGLDNRWRLYPGVDISYRPAADWKLFASWNMALRMPTFTDLYYSGANIEGSSRLAPEKTSDVAAGVEYRKTGMNIQTQMFYSHKSDMIDWVVYADETVDGNGNATPPTDWVYRSGNFTLDNYGIELQASLLPRELLGPSFPLRRLSASYAYISENIAYARPVALSKYAQEYLRHKVVVQADGRLWKNLTLSLSWRWQDRVGESNPAYALLDGRLSWDDSWWSAYVDCSNILDKTYYDYSIVRQPGRWLKAGVVFRLDWN